MCGGIKVDKELLHRRISLQTLAKVHKRIHIRDKRSGVRISTQQSGLGKMEKMHEGQNVKQ